MTPYGHGQIEAHIMDVSLFERALLFYQAKKCQLNYIQHFSETVLITFSELPNVSKKKSYSFDILSRYVLESKDF